MGDGFTQWQIASTEAAILQCGDPIPPDHRLKRFIEIFDRKLARIAHAGKRNELRLPRAWRGLSQNHLLRQPSLYLLLPKRPDDPCRTFLEGREGHKRQHKGPTAFPAANQAFTFQLRISISHRDPADPQILGKL